MSGRRRYDLEEGASPLAGERLVFQAGDSAAHAAELDGAFLAILDDGPLNDLLAPDEPPLAGRAVYAFSSAAERDAFLAELRLGMTRLGRR